MPFLVRVKFFFLLESVQHEKLESGAVSDYLVLTTMLDVCFLLANLLEEQGIVDEWLRVYDLSDDFIGASLVDLLGCQSYLCASMC